MPRCRLLSPLLCAVALACAPDPPPPAPIPAPRPGDRLLESGPRLTAGPALLPSSMAADVLGLLDTRGVTLDADAWRGGGILDGELVKRLGQPHLVGRLRRWTMRPAVRPDLQLGQPWLHHEGRPIPDARRTGEVSWADTEASLFFQWNPELGELAAFGERRPGALTLGYGPGALSRWLDAAGDALTPRPIALGAVQHRALALTAPSGLELRADLGHVTGLELSVAVAPVGLESDAGGTLRPAPTASDGVTFSVSVDERTLWSRHVPPADTWITARVDLAGLGPPPHHLVLRCDPGPAGDARFDAAAWAGLRFVGPPVERDPRPDIVLLDLDTLRADRLGCYGAERDSSPRIDAWAATHAVVYERSRAAGNWTLPSTVSLLTGLHVEQHGVHDVPLRLTAAMQPLPVLLAAAGYSTRARTDGGFLSTHFGFDAGFEHFDARPVEPDADGWSDELAWLCADDVEAPRFLFVQTYLAHTPFPRDTRFDDPAAPYAGPLLRPSINKLQVRAVEREQGGLTSRDVTYLNALYDAGVRRLDDLVGGFLEDLEACHRERPLVVLLTSDHGEELYDHGAMGHGHQLFGELLAVPFLLRSADGRPGRSDAAVHGIDVLPTLLDAAEVALPPGRLGRSLLAPREDGRPLLSTHDADTHALEWQGHKLVRGAFGRGAARASADALFDLTADGTEHRDLRADRPDLWQRLEQRLDALLAELAERRVGQGATGEIDAETRRALQALGYLQDG